MNKTPFLIYALDEDGRCTVGNPLAVVFIEQAADDWLGDKQTAKDEYLRLNPEEKGNMGWRTAENVYEDTFDVIDELTEALNVWKKIAADIKVNANKIEDNDYATYTGPDRPCLQHGESVRIVNANHGETGAAWCSGHRFIGPIDHDDLQVAHCAYC